MTSERQALNIEVAFSDTAPFGYVDANGNYAGFDVFLLERRLQRDMGVKINYIATDGQNRVRSSSQ